MPLADAGSLTQRPDLERHEMSMMTQMLDEFQPDRDDELTTARLRCTRLFWLCIAQAVVTAALAITCWQGLQNERSLARDINRLNLEAKR